jgi:hypothetical protein
VRHLQRAANDRPAGRQAFGDCSRERSRGQREIGQARGRGPAEAKHLAAGRVQDPDCAATIDHEQPRREAIHDLRAQELGRVRALRVGAFLRLQLLNGILKRSSEKRRLTCVVSQHATVVACSRGEAQRRERHDGGDHADDRGETEQRLRLRIHT